MAFVDDDVAVVGEELCTRVGTADGLCGDDVDLAAELLRLAPVLADGGVSRKLLHWRDRKLLTKMPKESR